MEKKKYVDESWKNEVANEKDGLAGIDGMNENENTHGCDDNCSCAGHDDNNGDGSSVIEVNFLNYLTSLGYQAMIFLGEIPNPLTNAVEQSVDQAKFLIDTLIMIKEKTKGNLTEQENGFLSATIYELEMKYVEVSEKEKKK